MANECSDLSWRSSLDSDRISFKNDFREIRDIIAAILQAMINRADLTVATESDKYEEQMTEIHYIAEPALADEYEAQMQEWSELQDLQDCQTTPPNILPEIFSSSDGCVGTKFEAEDVGPQMTSDAVIEGAPLVAVPDVFFHDPLRVDMVWLDFCRAHPDRQLVVCDRMIRMASYICHVVFVFVFLQHFKIRGRIFSKWGRLTGTETFRAERMQMYHRRSIVRTFTNRSMVRREIGRHLLIGPTLLCNK